MAITMSLCLAACTGGSGADPVGGTSGSEQTSGDNDATVDSGSGTGDEESGDGGSGTTDNDETAPAIPPVLTEAEWKSAFDGCNNYKMKCEGEMFLSIMETDGKILHTYIENTYNNEKSVSESIFYYAGDGIYYNYVQKNDMWMRQKVSDSSFIGSTIIQQNNSQLESMQSIMVDVFANAYASFTANAKKETYYCSRLRYTYEDLTVIFHDVTIQFDGKSIVSITHTKEGQSVGSGYSPASTYTYSDFGKVKIELPTEVSYQQDLT